MKIGMNLYLWTDAPRFDLHRAKIEFIKQVGFDSVEFPVAFMSSRDIAAFAKQCDSLGLSRTCVSVFDPSKCDPISPDPALRDAAVRALDECSGKAADLGADLLAGPFFQGISRFSGAPPTDDEWNRALETLHEACSLAGRRGVRIALEPLNRFEIYFANTLAVAKRFARELGLPNVGVLGDTMHANIEELDVPRAFADAMPELIHVHISESTRGTPGSGHGVPPALFDALKKAGYDGTLTIEAFSGGATPSMIPALCLWRDHGDDAEAIAAKGFAFIRGHL